MRSWITAMLAFALLSSVQAQAPARLQTPPPAQRQRVFVFAGPPAHTRSIWVLDANSRMSQYDATQFKMWVGGLPLPAEARQHPEGVMISRAGQVLFAYPPEGDSRLRRIASPDPRFGPGMTAGAQEKRPASGGGYVILSATPDVYFGELGDRLFWFEYREQRLNRGPDVWRDASFLAYRTDTAGETPEVLTQFSFPRCTCETGACQESCAQAGAWAPPEGVSDFFFVTRWVEGQIDSRYEQTALYQLKAGAWVSHKLAHPVEKFLDATDHGETFLEALPDAGCCGWANDTDDQTLVVRGDSSTVIFDERERFHNDDYDVSFFTANAVFAPDGTRVGYTLNDTQLPGQPEIRLSSDGKPNPAELEAVKKAIADMPRVEVVAVSTPKQVAVAISHAELIGWLDNRRLLILQGGELQTLDIATRKQTPTGIKADAAKFVFLR